MAELSSGPSSNYRDFGHVTFDSRSSSVENERIRLVLLIGVQGLVPWGLEPYELVYVFGSSRCFGRGSVHSFQQILKGDCDLRSKNS